MVVALNVQLESFRYETKGLEMIIRIRAPTGQFRVEIKETELISSLYEKIKILLKSDFQLDNELNPNDPVTVLKNGQILHVKSLAAKREEVKPVDHAFKYVKIDPIDEYLHKQTGEIKRKKNPQFCKHGDLGMCEYCLPLQPYDQNYLDENKIKHMSFHAYLRQLIDQNKIPATSSPMFIPPLDSPDYTVLTPCPAQTHAPYPDGICSKCQPSAITLQTQNFRMVDHVEFESPQIIENFIHFWRLTGHQRVGFLYGRYEPYEKVPLGVKAVISVIYEPPQESGHDSIQMLPDPLESQVSELASSLGLQKIGVVYSDLFDDGNGKGTVICKRHLNSYFLSSAEIIFSAKLQQKYPVKTRYSPTGEFGSRFVTVVISGNEDSNIDMQTYQVSNSAVSMTRDGIIEASVEPSLMRVCAATDTKYVPDVFYKYRNEYNIMVQEAAKPTFPVEYLLITSSHGFPANPQPRFVSNETFIENRISNARNFKSLKQNIESSIMDALSDFHLLLYLKESSILDAECWDIIFKIVNEKQLNYIADLQNNGVWQTLIMMLSEHDQTQQASSGGAPWACRHCTFQNIGGDSCEMCGLPPN
ncbi:nuclear protein localization protein 4 [Boothiomyces sp. JEL0866]|nr:nuclear protein localization protein 4 [Boothiomyces sp. JEL0866]